MSRRTDVSDLVVVQCAIFLTNIWWFVRQYFVDVRRPTFENLYNRWVFYRWRNQDKYRKGFWPKRIEIALANEMPSANNNDAVVRKAAAFTVSCFTIDSSRLDIWKADEMKRRKRSSRCHFAVSLPLCPPPRTNPFSRTLALHCEAPRIPFTSPFAHFCPTERRSTCSAFAGLTFSSAQAGKPAFDNNNLSRALSLSLSRLRVCLRLERTVRNKLLKGLLRTRWRCFSSFFRRTRSFLQTSCFCIALPHVRVLYSEVYFQAFFAWRVRSYFFIVSILNSFNLLSFLRFTKRREKNMKWVLVRMQSFKVLTTFT